MNAQEPKEFEEVLDYLEGKEKIVLSGCGGCATIFHTGGIEDLDRMEEKLEAEGKQVIGKIGMPLAVFACYLPMSGPIYEEHREVLEEADAILNQSCGDGLQAMRGYLEEEMGIVKPIYPANDALGFSSGGPSEFQEECQACGQCELGQTAGLCPLVHCPKGLLNGPCGGVRDDGTCEVDSDKDCVWVKIYERMEKLEQLEEFIDNMDPHDWSQQTRPRQLEVEPIDLEKELAGTKEALESMGI